MSSRSIFDRINASALGLIALLGVAAGSASAQVVVDAAGPWSVLDAVPPAAAQAPAWVHPDSGTPLMLDFNAMRDLLARAPLENTPRAATDPLVIGLPDPDGNWQRFRIVEYSVMEAPLAAAHPELRTYRGEGIDDPHATIRLSLTPLGFQAVVRSCAETGPYSGLWHIDAYSRNDTALHTSYWHADAGGPDRSFTCLTDENSVAAQSPFTPRTVTGPTLRQYRLALAVTGETTVWAGGASQGLALATTLTNQLNAIYEPELTVRFVLVASEASIVYTDPNTDPFTAPDSANTANTNLEPALDSTIGSANYDVGHVVHYTTAGNNGLAGGIGTVCTTGAKGAGYSGYSNPNDAYFVIDYVSHELGHQFGGHHTQSNCGGSAGDNAQYLVEAGSGTTIMSYAGICGAAYNVQAHNDPYFNGYDITQINTYLSGTSCAATSATGNNAPTIAALATYAIPSKTPFTLTASATDPDGDPVTYCWEQQDGASVQPVGTDPGSGPIDRSRPGAASPSRTIPQLSTILANGTDQWELLPQVARSAMSWRVTVRDSRSGGGGVNQATTSLQIVGTGPFQVTNPNTAGTLSGPINVTWALGGSNVAPIGCANVKISLSTDGGNTFPTVLAASVPNTGSAIVTLPDIATTTARLKVEAIGNIFFDISNFNFSIVPAIPIVYFSSGGSPVVVDTSGNGNSNARIDPGESSIALTLPISNTGTIQATGIHATLTSNTPTVSVLSGASAYPNTSAATASSNTTPYLLAVSPSHACGAQISLTLTLTCDQGVGSGGSGTLPIALSTGLTLSSTPVTISYSGAAATITDNSTTGINQTISVAGLGSINDLNFRFDGSACSTQSTSTTVGLSHSNVGQLIVTLTSPQGTTATIINRMAGAGASGSNSGNNFCNTVLDDAASTSIQTVTSSNAPFSGTFNPATPLAVFNGQNPNGIWTLNVADVVSGSTGTLRAWSLVITPQGGTTCAAPLPMDGACCDAAAVCTISTQAACTGTFQGGGIACQPNPCPLPPVQLTIVKTGSGRGTISATGASINCGTACTALVPVGTSVTLTAAPGQYGRFIGWSGGPCSGMDPCTLTVTQDTTITGEFRCRADFNGVDGLTTQDIFDYLNAWFAGDPATDVDGNPGLAVQDIFYFITFWFTGC